MKKQIHVLSRRNFLKLIPTLTDKQLSEVGIISIRDADFPIILPDSDNVLNLSFDDAESDQIGTPLIGGSWVVQLFNEEMAEQIVNHVNSNMDKNVWFIHCLMGQSRSAAIGDVLSTVFEIPYEEFKRLNPQIKPNSLVRSTLLKKFNL